MIALATILGALALILGGAVVMIVLSFEDIAAGERELWRAVVLDEYRADFPPCPTCRPAHHSGSALYSHDNEN